MVSQLLSDPGDDRITVSVRRADFLAAVGGAAVYTQIMLVSHSPRRPRPLVGAPTLAAGVLLSP